MIANSQSTKLSQFAMVLIEETLASGLSFLLKFNWDAQSIHELQDCTNAYEPSITASIPTSEHSKFLSAPLKIPKIPSHTQSCERAVKEVTCASAKVFGAERRDGFIRAKMESRELMPSMETKANLASLIPS